MLDNTDTLATVHYAYDGLKRLTDANHYPGAALTPSLTDTERSIAYDRNGNITVLKRYGNAGLENDLSFNHDGNRMTSLSDAHATGTEAGTKSFTYDANGNLVNDGRKGLELRLNVLNLVDSAGMHGSSLKYAWLSDGTKVSARTDDGSGNGVQKRYLGSFVYTSIGGHSTDTPTEVESVAWDEGRIFFDLPEVEDLAEEVVDSLAVVDSVAVAGWFRDCWFAGDHLGNVRSVIDITSDLVAPQILEQNDYLPFGTKIQNQNHAAIPMNNRWRYACKEAQRFGFLDLSLPDFGARMYDPFTARWTAVDPMAKDYPSQSPYSYCLSNPVSFVDPDGNAVTEIVLIALAKGTATALFDAGTQVAVHMINGDSFKGALGKIDLVSVGTSFVEGALNIPGIPAGAKAMVISVLRATDVAVDITTERGTESVFDGGKEISFAALDALGESTGLVWSDTITLLAKNGIKADLAKGYFWTLKKDDQLFLRNLSKTINSDGFECGVSILMDSGAGLVTEELKELTD